ncbi:MAG: DNA methyltransferase, partial [Promethearchaeota archaeon]
MKEIQKEQLIRGFIFACTTKTEDECLGRSLFGTGRAYGPIVIRIRRGDLLFLNNLDTDSLYGVFKAVSNGDLNVQPDAWNGKYPYQVKVEVLGEKIRLNDAKRILTRFRIKRSNPLFGRKLDSFLDLFIPASTLLNTAQKAQDKESIRQLSELKKKIRKKIKEVDIEEEIPLIEATNLWDFPKQSYGITPKGDNKYPGVTPALIIYNLIWRYTDPGDLVVDPMCGSGTTIDVCKEEKRKVIGYDIAPVRPDIRQNDARSIPLDDESADMIFVDSPYGDNIRYNEHQDCIGKISSEKKEFYDELEKVMKECHRILKRGKVLGWLIGDQWVKKRFTPVGFEVYRRLCRYFETVDTVCVTRRGQTSHTGLWYGRARRFNFYLRGFKYLFIMRKPLKEKPSVRK